MSGHLFDKYGAILQEDVEVLESCLTLIASKCHAEERFPRILEIGMHDGGTARGIENFFKAQGFPTITYWGIDPDQGKTRPRYVPTNGREIIGLSSEVFSEIPFGMDLVWVDGCHCMNCVILDVIHYAPKVRRGGFMCFHDINPVGQGQEHQYHGPVIPEFGLATDMALNAIGFPREWSAWERDGWEFFKEKVPDGVHNCGTRSYVLK